MTAPERIWAIEDGFGDNWWSLQEYDGATEYIRADLTTVQPAQVLDLIPRMEAIQACQVGPSDEWSKATKSGYEQAATDCARNILKINAAFLEPQPDPRDEVIARLVEALENRLHDPECPCNACEPMLAALAAAKAVQHD